MKNSMFVKGLVLATIALFIGVSIMPMAGSLSMKKCISTCDDISHIPSNTRGNTLYVGGTGEGNYTKIQDAIDNASDDDTVFVYDDSSPYYESVLIKKPVSLIGEDRDTTVIYGCIDIRKTDGVTVSGFTFKKGWPAISLWLSSNNIIKGNSITDIQGGVVGGIDAWCSSDNNIIMDNMIVNNVAEEHFYGIFIQEV